MAADTGPASPLRAGADTETLTARQEARRRRILAAGARLAAGGGFEAVQMREVARDAGVALGTLYRYFPSKVHLLVAVARDRLQRLRTALRAADPTGGGAAGDDASGDDAADRVAAALTRAFRALRREPQLADAMVRALTFADRGVCPEVDAVSRITAAIILEAARLDRPTPGQLSAVRVIEHTWHSALVCWLSGRISTAQVEMDLATVCRLIGPAAEPGTA